MTQNQNWFLREDNCYQGNDAKPKIALTRRQATKAMTQNQNWLLWEDSCYQDNDPKPKLALTKRQLLPRQWRKTKNCSYEKAVATKTMTQNQNWLLREDSCYQGNDAKSKLTLTRRQLLPRQWLETKIGSYEKTVATKIMTQNQNWLLRKDNCCQGNKAKTKLALTRRQLLPRQWRKTKIGSYKKTVVAKAMTQNQNWLLQEDKCCQGNNPKLKLALTRKQLLPRQWCKTKIGSYEKTIATKAMTRNQNWLLREDNCYQDNDAKPKLALTRRKLLICQIAARYMCERTAGDFRLMAAVTASSQPVSNSYFLIHFH
jgi:hypothetical protein